MDEKLGRDVRKGRQEYNVGSGKKCSSCGGTVAEGKKTCQNCGHSFSTLENRVAGLEAAVIAVFKSEGNPQALRDWYNDGAGGRVSWGEPGDFMDCVDKASEYMTDEEAKGFCNNRHQDATGAAPGHAPGEGKK